MIHPSSCRPLRGLLHIASPGMFVAPSATIEFVEPNSNLVVQGIPPIPARVADAVAGYTDFTGHAFVDWHPVRELRVSHRLAESSVA